MAGLKPQVGLVIRHAYLWWDEARAGREEALKDRPCVIVHTRMNDHREIEAYIAPVTHTPPHPPERGLEIPPATKTRLHLDEERSWIITSEVNSFIWPGPDLRPAPEAKARSEAGALSGIGHDRDDHRLHRHRIERADTATGGRGTLFRLHEA